MAMFSITLKLKRAVAFPFDGATGASKDRVVGH